MERSDLPIQKDVEFMRLLFTKPAEEKIGYEWARRLVNLLGPQALRLRPQTTFTEILTWGASANVDPMDFGVVFEPELRMDLAEFLDYSDHATFREMVQHCARNLTK